MLFRDAVSRSSVDDFWLAWSRHAEVGLIGACSLAGGPAEAGSAAFLGRDLLRIRSRRLGGRAVGRSGAGRLKRFSHSDEIDVGSAQHFVNSSLAAVLLFRRRLKSVADVLKGIRSRGFSQARWEALLRFWDAVCRHGPCHPWDKWVLPVELSGFGKILVLGRMLGFGLISFLPLPSW